MAFLKACEQRLALRCDLGKIKKINRIEAFDGVCDGGCSSEQRLTVARLEACDAAYDGRH